jgi:hypothetical protein
VRKCFAEHTTATGGPVVPHLNGSAQQKRDLWVRRYDCLKQRTLRNPFFAPPSTTYRMPTQANRQVHACAWLLLDAFSISELGPQDCFARH